MKNCLDEGLLQGYLDGELSPALMKQAAAHLAACASCAEAVREAEAELSIFSSVFAPDDALVVPTERLRQRIDASIAQLEAATAPDSRASVFAGVGQRLSAWFSTLAASLTLSPASAAAFAGVAALVIVGAVFFAVEKNGTPQGEIAGNVPQPLPASGQATKQPAAPSETSRSQTKEALNGQSPEALQGRTPETPEQTFVRQEQKGGQAGAIINAGFKASRATRETRATKTQTTDAQAAGERKDAEDKIDPKQMALPGEENYVIAIASLNKVIEVGGDAVLRPALRADFERNVAVLDKAIDESRSRAIRNPKDKDAMSFLFAAYQSKVELLSAVADQAQVAALGR